MENPNRTRPCKFGNTCRNFQQGNCTFIHDSNPNLGGGNRPNYQPPKYQPTGGRGGNYPNPNYPPVNIPDQYNTGGGLGQGGMGQGGMGMGQGGRGGGGRGGRGGSSTNKIITISPTSFADFSKLPNVVKMDAKNHMSLLEMVV